MNSGWELHGTGPRRKMAHWHTRPQAKTKQSRAQMKEALDFALPGYDPFNFINGFDHCSSEAKRPFAAGIHSQTAPKRLRAVQTSAEHMT